MQQFIMWCYDAR